MNLSEIKEIIAREGGKIVIVENDRPQLIIMSFDEYRGRVLSQEPKQMAPEEPSPFVSDISPQGVEDIEPRINPYSPPRIEGDQSEGLTIDDLPL